jgi:hypothetical protein
LSNSFFIQIASILPFQESMTGPESMTFPEINDSSGISDLFGNNDLSGNCILVCSAHA